MKFWVKIIVAVCVVLVIGFAVWAFCFREKDEVQAYNRTAELIDYKQSLGIREKLIDLRAVNYTSNNPEKIINEESEVGKQIYNLRDICLSESVIESGGDLSYYSYIVMDKYVDELFEYYLPYTQSSKVKSKSLKKLKSSVEDYMKSLSALNKTINNLIEYQSLIEGSDTELSALSSHYHNLYDSFRSSLNISTDVLLSLVEYVDVSVYSDDIKFDVLFALNDSYVRSLKVSSSVKNIIEPNYASDVKMVMDLVIKFKNGENIFTEEYKEYDFLQSYNALYNNHKDSLNFIFSCTNEQKQQMAEEMSNSDLSNIVENAKKPTVNVLNVLGYGR